MHKYISFDEYQLMSLYNPGNRAGLIETLQEVRGYLSAEDKEVIEVTDSCLRKLRSMTDAEYDELDLFPDHVDTFDEMEDIYAD